MERRRLILSAVAVCLIAAITYFVFVPSRADELFINGHIYTLDADNTVAEAIAVRGDRIVGVGSSGSIVRKFKAPATVDLGGKTVLPGFIDSHAHFLSLGLARLTLDLSGAQSEREAAERVAQGAARAAPGKWIRGRGWDQNRWPTKRFPVRQSLDRVSPQNPVFLSRVDGHAAWVNSMALGLGGVTKSTPDPPGGRIERDPNGNPTGVLIDNAQELVRSQLPGMTDEDAAEAIHLAIQEFVSDGLTEVHDMGVDSNEIRVYKHLIDRNEFPFRVYAAIGGVGGTWDEISQKGPIIGYGGNRLTIRSLKLYVDGALGSRGAALIEPYNDDPGNRGLTVTSEEVLRRAVDEALARGFQVCTHAIGDRANNIILNVYENALKNHPTPDARLRVEHAQILEPDDIPRFKKLGVIPSMQPTHCTSDMYWAESRLGPSRIRGAYAWRSLLRTGVFICGGSDCPVEDPNPILGIYAACTRQDKFGKPRNASDVAAGFQLSREGITDSTAFQNGWYESQRMTRDEAVRCFTIWAARGAFEESVKGSLENGKLADFVVLSSDVMTVPAVELLSTVVEKTVIGGAVVYTREAQP